MFIFLLIVQMLVAASLVVFILMQRSEGGGLGVGGSSSGLMTARGAADFLTRGTAILATLFVTLSIVLAAMAAVQRAPTTIDPNLARQAPAAPLAPTGPAPGAAPDADALAGAAAQVPVANGAAPALPPAAQGNGTVPLAH